MFTSMWNQMKTWAHDRHWSYMDRLHAVINRLRPVLQHVLLHDNIAMHGNIKRLQAALL